MLPSSKNTESASTSLTSIVRTGEPTKRDEQVSVLERQIQSLQDDKLQERFLWYMASGALLLVISFGIHAGAGAVLAPIYLASLLVLSRQWGFEGLWEALYDARKLLKGEKDDPGA